MLPGFDRPHSIAGRVLSGQGDNHVTKLVNIDRDLVMIPNVAIHMNQKLSMMAGAIIKQVDMLPLFQDSKLKQEI